ncbi:MAG: replicative DNA helicase [Pseudomonadota bacterium]
MPDPILSVDNQVDDYRLPPHNVEAEQALLGAILVNNEAFYRVSDFLMPDHFFDPVHRQIYEIISDIIRANKVATPITIKTFLDQDLRIGDLSGPQYLARLAAEATTVINAADFGRTIYELSQRRQLILIGEDIVNDAFDAPVDDTPGEQIERAERALYDIAETGRYDGGFVDFSGALVEAIDNADRAFKRDGHLSGTSTGLRELDRMMGGLQRSDLIIIAGRPAMGKSALATNIGFNVAKAYESNVKADGEVEAVNGGVVAIFSLEMSADQLATRIISEQTTISSDRIRKGTIDENEFATLVDVSQQIQRIPLFIDDTGGLSIAQLAARARRLKRQKGLDVIIIDYVQLLSGSSKRAGENRVQEITEITTNLKALAKELNVPVIALAQLSRQVENRDDKRPQLADLRESGSIEQDADVVLFIYRDEYYLERKKPRENTPEFEQWRAQMEEVHGVAEVIIGKQRHGPTGTVHLQFEKSLTRFSDLANDGALPDRFE